jgi:hypothetical protein
MTPLALGVAMGTGPARLADVQRISHSAETHAVMDGMLWSMAVLIAAPAALVALGILCYRRARPPGRP